VGVGGMGVVLKAIDPSLDRVVALKVLSPRLANSENARKRFAREAKAAAAVLHPNVIPIHSVSSGSTLPFLVMSYIRGGSLQKRLDQEGARPLVEILRIGSQIAAGLAAAHEQGLIHRDIKPENILLEEGVERVTITDFGLARSVDDNTITQLGSIAGTPQYMSPEQASGEQLDQQSDLFSLGSLLYALCTGRPPYRDDTSYGVMRKIIDEAPTPIQKLSPETPTWMVSIVEQLMAKKKEDRFASANEVHTLLDACLSHVQQPLLNPIPSSLVKQPRSIVPLLTGVCTMTIISILLLWMTGVQGLLVQNPPAIQDESSRSGGIAVPSALSDDFNIQGTWQVVFSEEEGISPPPEALRGIRFLITKDKVITELGGRKLESTYTLDASTSPKSIDLTSNGRTELGIYDLQGDTLRLCHSESTNLRPTAFDSQPNSVNDLVITMKRIRPEPMNEKTEPKPKDNRPTDSKAIEGTWSVVMAVDSGRTTPPEALQDIRFVITKDKLIMESKGRKQESTYKLNPSTWPKSIDLTEDGHTKPGIYDLQGDTLRICTSETTDIRPSTFISQPDSVNDLVITMKRISPEKLPTEPTTQVD
ncbi:MAG: protein kinase domain-containing protein, partial [Pirellula sp.]